MTDNHNRNNKTKAMATRAMLVAVAFVLSWLEAQIPAFFAVPGMKLGLTNLVVLVALYILGSKDALGINLLRILLVGLTFGNAFSLLYSAAGGILSGTCMILLKKTGRFSVTAVSIAGGVMHNVGQIIVAMIVLETKALAYYLIPLWASGIVAGAIIGILSSMVIKRLPKSIAE